LFFFGDGFELYAAPADAYAGGTYWDSGSGNWSLVAGRFSGSRAAQNLSSGAWMQKASGQNDGIHHINLAFQQTAPISGTTLGFYVRLTDGATNQCTVVFRTDGAILLVSGGPTGTVLATYTGAVTVVSTWYGFEMEVVVHNTAGSFTVRKNGNPANDFTLGSLNTRGGTANNYANGIAIGMQSPVSGQHTVDDFLWRSDAASVPWAGEVRCFTRMPASDVTVQWTPSGSVVPASNYPGGTNANTGLAASARYLPFTAPIGGTVGSATMQCATAVTANIKCAIYAAVAGVPTTVLGSATLTTNPGIGTTTFTFSTPVPVTQGAQYFLAFRQDTASGAFNYLAGTPPGGYVPLSNSTTYAAFPETNPPSTSVSTNYGATINITPSAANAGMVADTMQDAAASYVSSSTPGQTDLYGIAPIAGTPTGIVGVTTRALAQKSDAGTRNVALRLRSGATDVTGTSTALGTAFGWVWRSDTVDPATGAAWSAVAVANLKIGQTVSA
jgi:hypothetical protein